MTDLYRLPRTAVIGGREYPIHCDFRDILEIFSYFDDPDLPAFLKWRIAIALFYEGELPPEDYAEAAGFLSDFIRCGAEEKGGTQLLSWQQDAPLIIADVNRVAGKEVRQEKFIHWWTFLSYFHGIGEGQLSFIVSLREKLQKGKKLEPWEQEYYLRNRKQVTLAPRYTAQEKLQRQALLQMLEA